jgi:putative nucleotidyltransferase with HDIG domain
VDFRKSSPLHSIFDIRYSAVRAFQPLRRCQGTQTQKALPLTIPVELSLRYCYDGQLGSSAGRVRPAPFAGFSGPFTAIGRRVKPFEKIELVLKQRSPGWWDRVASFIPELRDLKGTPQPPQHHAEGDASVHTRLAVEAVPEGLDPDVLWATLLHDIGKPATTKGDEGRITAHGHAAVGADMARSILQRLEMGPDRRERIVWAIRHHMFHLSWNLSTPEAASRRQKRFVADPRFPLLLELLRMDSAGSPQNPRRMEAYELYRALHLRVKSVGSER